MAQVRTEGWIKSHRRMEFSPVWRHRTAAGVFQWILWNAEPFATRRMVTGGAVRLQRGQLFVTYDEVAARNFVTVKEARTAFATLKKLECITWVANPAGLRGLLVTVTNYSLYQDPREEALFPEDLSEVQPDPSDAVPFPLHGEAENDGQASGQAKTAPSGQANITEAGRHNGDAKAMKDNDIPEQPSEGGAGKTMDGGQAKNGPEGQAIGQVYKEQEVKNNSIPPYPPLEKGGRSAASPLSDNDKKTIRGILALWREECAAAGRPLAEDVYSDRDVKGAKRLALTYVAQAGLNRSMLRAGMQTLLKRIATDSGARMFDLYTFAKDPVKFGVRPLAQKKASVMALWSFVCNVCREGREVSLPRAPTPPVQPCVRHTEGCQGTMRPTFLREIT